MGPMVAMTNQFAGSDGDIFSHCFKLYKLGPLVGKRTWGGVIEFSLTSTGRWKCYNPNRSSVSGLLTPDGGVENHGTDPDYDVDIAPHEYNAGEDPQMAKALSLVLDQMKKKPVKLPDFSIRPSLPIPEQLLLSKSKPGKAASKTKTLA